MISLLVTLWVTITSVCSRGNMMRAAATISALLQLSWRKRLLGSLALLLLADVLLWFFLVTFFITMGTSLSPLLAKIFSTLTAAFPR